MSEAKSPDDSTASRHDGATLEIKLNFEEQLPYGLARLPSGAISVTSLYCPNGHNLITETAARFNNYPGITLQIEGEHTQGHVILSPIHGDDTKFGESDFEPGELLKVTCPMCGIEFPHIQPCGCQDGAQLIGFFLDAERSEGNQVVICNAWGCLRSRILDRYHIISKFE